MSPSSSCRGTDSIKESGHRHFDYYTSIKSYNEISMAAALIHPIESRPGTISFYCVYQHGGGRKRPGNPESRREVLSKERYGYLILGRGLNKVKPITLGE